MEQTSLSAAATSVRPAAAPTRSSALPADAARLVVGALKLADILTVPLAALWAFWLRYGTLDFSSELMFLAILGTLAMTHVMKALDAYEAPGIIAVLPQAIKIGTAWVLLMAALLSLVFFGHFTEAVARLWVALWAGTGMAMMIAWRQLARVCIGVFRRTGTLRTNVAIVGDPEAAERIRRRLAAEGDPGVHVVGSFALREGGVGELARLAGSMRIDEIVVAVPAAIDAGFNTLLRRVTTLPAAVSLCPDFFEIAQPPRRLRSLGALLLMDVCERPLPGWGVIWKRVEDVLLAGVLLVFFAPLMLAVALAIRFDSPGPILFRQKRIGLNGRVIEVLKFRTMRADAGACSKVAQATRNDPRITRIGWFLRRSSVDELPQLFNVLRGEMSIVGPRPHAVVHIEHYAGVIEGLAARHRMKPGITGWAQVRGCRGEIRDIEAMRRRVALDLEYIERWSLWLDLKILLRTAVFGFIHPNAY